MRTVVVAFAVLILAIAGCGGNGHRHSPARPQRLTACALIVGAWQKQGVFGPQGFSGFVSNLPSSCTGYTDSQIINEIHRLDPKGDCGWKGNCPG